MSYGDWCTMRENMPVKRTHQIFILLYLHFSIVHSYFERVCDSRTEQRGPDPNGICGRMIPEMLHLLCEGEYYVPSHSKRDVSSRDHKQESNLDFPRYSPLEGLILGKREASMYLTSEHSRTKRNTYTGIVCECCYHSCDYVELFQYCAYRKKRDTKPNSVSANSHNSRVMVDKLSN